MKNRSKVNSTTDKIIFSLLAGLLVLLLVVPLFFNLFPELENYSDSDFENEILGKAYFASVNKSYDQEIYYYNQLRERFPELSPELYAKIGDAYEKKGEFFKAIEFYNKALINNYCDSLQVFYKVATIAHHLKNYKMAEKYYKKSSASQFISSDAFFNLGNISNFVYENKKEALQYYRNAIEMPSAYQLWEEMLNREMKNYSKRQNPDIFDKLRQLSETDIDSVDFSRFDLKELLRNQWEENQPLIHNYMGIIYASSHQKERAIEHFQKALSINPEFKDAKYNLQKVLLTAVETNKSY